MDEVGTKYIIFLNVERSPKDIFAYDPEAFSTLSPN
jgi:hypothetical protein